MPNPPPSVNSARAGTSGRPYATSFRLYRRAAQGAILPIEEEDGMRWESIELDGTAKRWRYNQARDYLCGLPSSQAVAGPHVVRRAAAMRCCGRLPRGGCHDVLDRRPRP
jgi:hypothetical protein